MIHICSFSPSVFTATGNIKAHQEYQSRSIFKFDQELFRLRILNRMQHAGTIDICTVIGPLGQIRTTTGPLLAVRMCSTKSSTPFISSFSIKKLSFWSRAVGNFTIIGRILPT